MLHKIIIKLIKAYQLILSPYLGNNCRFHPSCSQYSIDAFKKYNFFTASYLSIKRILKCNPFNVGGYDPVPMFKN